MALTADVIVATEDATFSCAFLKLGLTGCELGTSFFLNKYASKNAALLMLTGDDLTAKRALEMGIVQKLCVTRDEMRLAAFETARRMINNSSPLGLVLTKRQIRAALEGGSYVATVHAENNGQLFCLNDPATKAWTLAAVSRFVKKTSKL